MDQEDFSKIDANSLRFYLDDVRTVHRLLEFLEGATPSDGLNMNNPRYLA